MLKEIKTNRLHYFEDEHGRRQGRFTSWYENGQIATQCFYVNHILHGEYKWWHDGQIYVHCFYVDGKKISFKEIPLPQTETDRTYIMLKYGLQTFKLEDVC